MDDAPENSAPAGRWWGEFDLTPNQRTSWRIGAFRLWVDRHEREWRAAYLAGRDRLDPTVEVRHRDATDAPDDGATGVRFIAPGPLIVEPTLADRSVVTRPGTSFEVAAHAEATIFLSTPVWIRLRAGEAGPSLLHTTTFELSDTWFGPSTMEGELCYASRTQARLDLAELPMRPNRAVTKVVLRNLADDTMHVERFSLPTPNIALYADEDANLWTSSVTLERESDGEMVQVNYDDSAPAEVDSATLVAAAVQPAEKNMLRRAVKALLS